MVTVQLARTNRLPALIAEQRLSILPLSWRCSRRGLSRWRLRRLIAWSLRISIRALRGRSSRRCCTGSLCLCVLDGLLDGFYGFDGSAANGPRDFESLRDIFHVAFQAM